jgi:hypothetical protein
MPTKKINIHDIINCNLDYECHLQWDRLDQTDKSDVRYCQDCKSTVTFVRTQEELAAASDNGKCVAYVMFKGATLEKVLHYNQHGGDFPLSAPPVTMGIPNRES